MKVGYGEFFFALAGGGGGGLSSVNVFGGIVELGFMWHEWLYFAIPSNSRVEEV